MEFQLLCVFHSGTQVLIHLPVVFCWSSACVCSPCQTPLSASVSVVRYANTNTHFTQHTATCITAAPTFLVLTVWALGTFKNLLIYQKKNKNPKCQCHLLCSLFSSIYCFIFTSRSCPLAVFLSHSVLGDFKEHPSKLLLFYKGTFRSH